MYNVITNQIVELYFNKRHWENVVSNYLLVATNRRRSFRKFSMSCASCICGYVLRCLLDKRLASVSARVFVFLHLGFSFLMSHAIWKCNLSFSKPSRYVLCDDQTCMFGGLLLFGSYVPNTYEAISSILVRAASCFDSVPNLLLSCWFLIRLLRRYVFQNVVGGLEKVLGVF